MRSRYNSLQSFAPDELKVINSQIRYVTKLGAIHNLIKQLKELWNKHPERKYQADFKKVYSRLKFKQSELKWQEKKNDGVKTWIDPEIKEKHKDTVWKKVNRSQMLDAENFYT